MYADIDSKIAKIRGQIDDVSYKMIEAEGEEYQQLSDKLEQLEAKLEEMTMISNDMELLHEYGD